MANPPLSPDLIVVPPIDPPSLMSVLWMKWEDTASKTAKISAYIFAGLGIAALSLADGMPALALTLLPAMGIAALVFAVSGATYFYYMHKLNQAKDENAKKILEHLQANHTTQGLQEFKKHGVYFKELGIDCSKLPVESDKSLQVTTFFNNVSAIFPRVKKLNLSKFNCSDAVYLGMLSKLPLEELILDECALTDDQLKAFGNIPTLKKLIINKCSKFTEKGIESLGDLKIEELIICNPSGASALEDEKGAAFVDCIKKWDKLKHIRVDEPDDDFVEGVLVHAKALETFAVLKSTKLKGDGFDVANSAVKHIELNKCQQLNVANLTHLCALKNIETVSFDMFTNLFLSRGDKVEHKEVFMKFRKVFRAPDKEEITFQGTWRHKVNIKE